MDRPEYSLSTGGVWCDPLIGHPRNVREIFLNVVPVSQGTGWYENTYKQKDRVLGNKDPEE